MLVLLYLPLQPEFWDQMLQSTLDPFLAQKSSSLLNCMHSFFRFLASYILAIFMVQGVYYYFYQIFRNKAEAAALERMKNGIGDGSVGMLSSLVVAALSG